MYEIFFVNIAEAAVPAIPQSVKDFVGKVYDYVLNPLIALMFAVATVYFIYGVVAYIWNPDNAELREQGRRSMIWGIVGMFVMVSVFSIMKLLINSIGADATVMNNV